MQSRSTIVKRAAFFCAVLGVVVFAVTRPNKVRVGSADVQDPPSEIELTGIAYDFRQAHPDFEVTPEGGWGHYAGNVQMWLPGTNRPAFTGGGFRVDDQWRDASNRPIAPHMANVRGGIGGREHLGLRVNGKIEIKEEAWIDAFNSNYGPYGLNGNYGGHGTVATNAVDDKQVKIDKKGLIRGDVYVGPGASAARVIENKGIITGEQRSLDEAYPMPEIALPDDLAAYEEHVHIETAVTLTGDTDPDDDVEAPALHYGKLHLKDGAIVTIVGDLRILCDDEFKAEKTQIILAPEAKLTLYATSGAKVEFKDQTLVNVTTGDTTAVAINAVGEGKLKIEKNTHLYATIVAPRRKLEVKEAHFYGGFIGEALKVEKKAGGVHIDLGNAKMGNWNFALTVRDKIEIEENSEVDGFDSNAGPYGETNSGAYALLTTNAVKDKKVKIKKNSTVGGDVIVGPWADPYEVIEIKDGGVLTGSRGSQAVPAPIPVVSPPALGESVGDLKYDGGTHTLTGQIRCKKLKLEHHATVEIAGNVTIRCDDKVEVKDHSEIRLLPDSTLTLYVKKDLKIEKHSYVNLNTGNPQLVSIRRTSVGKGKVELKDHARLCAWVQGVGTEMKVEDHSEFFGSFTGRKVKVKKHSRFHVDMAYLTTCVDVADQAGEAGDGDTGGVTSAESFDQWFRNVLGTNQSMALVTTLVRNEDGVYEHLADDFHPIDGRLFGNEGQPHNNYFTYAIHAEFQYPECGGGFIEFQGGDGAYLFVAGQLVMDVGGVQTPERQFVDLDRLGLQGGQTYDVHFFYAQRHSGDSVFRLRTNIALSTEGTVPNVTAQFD